MAVNESCSGKQHNADDPTAFYAQADEGNTLSQAGSGSHQINQTSEGDQNQNIGTVKDSSVFNISGGQPTIQVLPSVMPTTERNPNEELLYDQVRQEVTSRLRASLHNSALIKLGLRDDSEQVKSPFKMRPWSSSRINVEVNKILDLSIGTMGVFDQDEVGGKLLILGKPGSGKTTTLLDIASELLERAAQSAKAPTPILLNLSSWQKDQQSIDQWLVTELRLKYGVSQKLGQKLLKKHRLIPLLDGLDELATHRQTLCVQRLNEWLGSELRPMSVVVCSRIQEYKNCKTKLHLSGAIYLRPLSRCKMTASSGSCPLLVI